MSAIFVSALFAADPPPSNPLATFAPMIIIFVLFYFMLIRPQRRAQKELQLKLAALRSGDEVIACGGIHGLVTNVNDRLVTLKIADNVKIKVEKASVMTILKKSDDPEPEPPAAEPDTAAN
jgi:preprotein translocase subunit YajC